jgi:adenylate kinase
MKMMIIGPQGSGKGTYADRLSEKFGVPHISTGEIFRENIKQKTELGKNIEKFVNSGLLVPDDVTMKVVEERINKPDCKKGFIFDGFPRTTKQAEELEKISPLDVVLYLDCPEWLLVKRMSSRITCKNCGKIYNLLNVKPKKEGVCNDCEGKLVVREDETPEAIKMRLKEYEKGTKPLIDYYDKKGILKRFYNDVFERSPEECVSKILDILGVKK